MAGKNVQVFNEMNWEQEVLKSDLPVLVDFTATWCGPCRQLAPIIDQVSNDYAGRAKVGKLDIDDNSSIAARYGIRGVPTMLVFRGGKEVGRQVGLVPRPTVSSLLERALG